MLFFVLFHRETSNRLRSPSRQSENATSLGSGKVHHAEPGPRTLLDLGSLRRSAEKQVRIEAGRNVGFTVILLLVPLIHFPPVT